MGAKADKERGAKSIDKVRGPEVDDKQGEQFLIIIYRNSQI